MSPDGLGWGGHKFPRMRGYSCQPNSSMSRRFGLPAWAGEAVMSPECGAIFPSRIALRTPSDHPTRWPGRPPRPLRARGPCEGRGEGRSQGCTADGHPPSGVAPAAVMGRTDGSQAWGRTGETLMSPDGLGGGGHDKVPRMRGYLSKSDSPENAIRPPLGQAGRPGPCAPMGRARDGA